MDPATQPTKTNSNPTAASPGSSSLPAAAPAKTGADSRSQQRDATAEPSNDKNADTGKRLGERWKNMFNLKAQWQRHPVAAVLSGLAVVLGIGGGITIGALESQRRKSFSYRVKKGFRLAKSRLMTPMR